MRLTIQIFWAVFILTLVVGLGAFVWGVASASPGWLLLGLSLYVCGGAIAMRIDWLHERYVLWRYTRWD